MKRLLGRVGLGVATALLLGFCLLPVLWQLITSLKPTGELTRLPPLLPSHFSGHSYVSVFAPERHFGRIIWNSLVVAGTTTCAALCIGSLAAFALAKLQFPGRRALLFGTLLVSMFPPIATVSPLYLIIRALGLRDHLLGLILCDTAFSLPLCIWILTSFFRAVPDELYKAARIDGCSPLRAFVDVMLPLSLPGLATTAILVFIFSWNEFLYALTFTTTEASRTIPVGITLFPGVHEVPWGELAAASILVTMPLLGLVLLFQRQIVAGLTAGAVKG